MKKARVHPMVLITCVFAALLIGFFLGRNFHSAPVQIQSVTAPPMETTAETETEPEETGPININTATVEQLMELPGIGETYATRIVEYRTENGPFDSVGALIHVPGIGEKRLEAIWDLITVGG